MKPLFAPFRLAAAAALFAAAPFALANGNVNWSVSVGSGGYPAPVYAPAPVYVQPEPVYVRPAPVYVRPAPVYVAPPTAVVQYGAPLYVQEVRPRHWHHHHGHYRD
ncbi:virulence factor [Oxalobacteraceae bacterium OM1]|nr:virulence factor [Oxalobacteraceae bacterium OM1]